MSQVGGVIRTVTLPTGPEGEPFCFSGVGTAVAIVPGAAVGLPKEPVLLVTTCVTTDPEQGDQVQQQSKLFFFRPTAGTATAPLLTVETVQFFEGAFPFAPPGGWGALALRADKGDLIACGNKFPFSEDTHRVYRIPLSKTFATDEVPVTAPVELFGANGGPGGGTICSGIAWDSVTNLVYQSPDNSSTVFRFTEAGLQDETTIPVPSGCNTLLREEFSLGRAAGLAVSGQNLYIACGDDPEIFRVNKNTGTVVDSFGSAGLRSADLECDPVTFGSLQKDVLWTKGVNDNSLVAVEVERGSCGGAIPVVLGPLCSSMTDTDGDGLLDCWEQPSPPSAGAGGKPCIDVDGDGVCDLVLCVDSGDGKGEVCANPLRKDVFVEIDWLETHQPNQAAITRLINRFEAAPVANPGASLPGIRLHVQRDDVLRDSGGTMIPHNSANAFANGLIAFEPYTATAGTGVLDFDVLKQHNFGTAAQRANPKALDAKRQAFRYMIFGHLLAGLGGSSGAAEVHGNDGLVTLGAGSIFLGHPRGSEDQQAGTLMHELGHLLGLRHGGDDFLGCKPNYLSVMNYTRQLPGVLISTTQWRATGFDYSRSKLPDLNKNNLNEQAGVGNVLGDQMAFGPGAGVVRSTAGAVDWNRNNVTGITALSIPLLNQIVNSGGTVCDGAGSSILSGYNDWANLKYDVRSSVDIADGSRLSLGDKETEIGFEAPADNPCTGSCIVADPRTDEGVVDSDGDGVPDLFDNCPTVPNPDQANVCAETNVVIDILPKKYPNTVRLNSGVPFEVAILGSMAFDATQVRPETIKLAGAPVMQTGPVFHCKSVDVNDDGFTDLLCKVNQRELVLLAEHAVAVLTGMTADNVSIRGEDSIHIIRPRGQR